MNAQSAQYNTRYDGDDLRAMFATALALLERNVDAINALNVFPVPDGDTGTNMFLTLRDVIEETEALKGTPSAEMVLTKAMGRGTMSPLMTLYMSGGGREAGLRIKVGSLGATRRLGATRGSSRSRVLRGWRPRRSRLAFWRDPRG